MPVIIEFIMLQRETCIDIGPSIYLIMYKYMIKSQ